MIFFFLRIDEAVKNNTENYYMCLEHLLSSMSHTSKTSYSTGKEENEEEIGEGEMKTKDVFKKKIKRVKRLRAV